MPIAAQNRRTPTHSPDRRVARRFRGKASYFSRATRSAQPLLRVISSSSIGLPSWDERLHSSKLLLRGGANLPVPQPGLVRGVGTSERGDVLAIPLDHVFTPPAAPNDVAAIVRLNE